MIKANIAEDLCTITHISKLSLENLFEKMSLCISHSVFEATQSKENQAEIDIGIGSLYIRLEDDKIKYKFIPSKILEENIAVSLNNRISLLAHKADVALGERIENAYRCLL